jgi:hypothetical protein
MKGQDVADYFNKLYYSFDADNPTSSSGLTMNLPSDQKSFFGNIFCASYNNPHGRTSCSGGRCDCRFSAAMYNNKMLITEGYTIMDSIGRKVGILFNQSLVENKYARCSFLWDGATNNKYNVGCGLGAPGNSCADKKTAFFNICPSTGKVCTKDDPESVGGLCDKFGGQHPFPPAHSIGFQCALPGPAINYHGQDDWQPETENNIREMVTQRLKYQDGIKGEDTEGGKKILKSKQWTEIVMDTRLLMPDIWKDPAVVVPGIAYWADDKPALDSARTMRDDFCEKNKLEAKIPLIKIQWHAIVSDDKKEPVFGYDSADDTGYAGYHSQKKIVV